MQLRTNLNSKGENIILLKYQQKILRRGDTVSLDRCGYKQLLHPSPSPAPIPPDPGDYLVTSV
jgi:hypothetical protein